MESKFLKELCFPNKCGVYGIPASAEDYDESKTRYLRISDISEDGKLLNSDKKSVSDSQIEKYLLEDGDIVFARTGNSTGKSYYHEEKNGELAFAGFLIKFSLDPSKVNPKYLRYYTITEHYRQWVENFSLGSTRGNLNANSFSNCPIPLPSRKQQDFLVKVLSDLDAKIEVNNNINAELEAMAKLIYDYWFVQFDFPDENGKPYKSSGGKMVYNEELKREIPEVWEDDIVGNKLDVVLGGTPSTKRNEFWNGDIPWLNSGEVANFPIIDSEEKITQEGVNNSATVLMPKGSCVLSITRHLRASILAVDSCANQSVVGILETGNLKSEYLYPYLLNELPRLMSLRTGAQQPHINKGTVEESKILIPNTNTLESYYSKVESFYKNIINNSKQNQQLTELRDWLLPMLMNGQITVGDAQEHVGMVVEKRSKL